MKQYRQHPIGSIIPAMSPAEFTSLSEDIKTNKLKVPIVLYEGMILDGWSRYKACVSGSYDYSTVTYEGDQPVSYVISLNAKRRHLDANQLAAVGVDVEQPLSIEARKRQATSTGGTTPQLKAKLPEAGKGQARDKAAELLGVSARYISDAKTIKKVSPESFEKVKAGELTIKEAKNVIYKAGEVVKKDISAVQITSDNCKLHNCDILDAPIKDNSLDVIITDPPYPREYLDCWHKLAEFAVKKLKPNGVLLAMSGQYFLPEVYKNMTVDGLDYYWTGCIWTPGVSSNLHYKRLRQNWKPLLIYCKGEYKGTFQSTDVYESKYEDTAKGQEFHRWGQSYKVFDQLVKDWTYAKDVVCDPFLGGGTTGVAVLNNKRNFVGVEINSDAFKTASARINEVLQ